VRIISEKAIREFCQKHPDAVASLTHWRRVVRGANWKSGADVKATLASSDLVGDKTVLTSRGIAIA